MNRPGFVSYQPLFSMNLPVGQLIHQLLRSFLFTVWLINQAAIEMGSRDADRLESGSECYQFSISVHFGRTFTGSMQTRLNRVDRNSQC